MQVVEVQTPHLAVMLNHTAALALCGNRFKLQAFAPVIAPADAGAHRPEPAGAARKVPREGVCQSSPHSSTLHQSNLPARVLNLQSAQKVVHRRLSRAVSRPTKTGGSPRRTRRIGGAVVR